MVPLITIQSVLGKFRQANDTALLRSKPHLVPRGAIGRYHYQLRLRWDRVLRWVNAIQEVPEHRTEIRLNCVRSVQNAITARL